MPQYRVWLSDGSAQIVYARDEAKARLAAADKANRSLGCVCAVEKLEDIENEEN